MTCSLKLVWRSVCRGAAGRDPVSSAGDEALAPPGARACLPPPRCASAAGHSCEERTLVGGAGLLMAPRKDFMEFCVCRMRLT